jgi:hypothetical protein
VPGRMGDPSISQLNRAHSLHQRDPILVAIGLSYYLRGSPSNLCLVNPDFTSGSCQSPTTLRLATPRLHVVAQPSMSPVLSTQDRSPQDATLFPKGSACFSSMVTTFCWPLCSAMFQRFCSAALASEGHAMRYAAFISAVFT